MPRIKILPTLGGKSTFGYEGSILTGTEIHFGKEHKNKTKITAIQYTDLIGHFKGKTIIVGNSRRNRPPGSLGEWLKIWVTSATIATYVAKILVSEGYAKKEEGMAIRFY